MKKTFTIIFSLVSFLLISKNASEKMLLIDNPTVLLEGTVVINEFMAANDATVADQDGEFDDWIELHNTSNMAVDLTGYFLSDNPENLDKYDIPDGTIIPANGYLIVWADEDGMQEGLHANFKLARAGEELFLVNPDTMIIDEIIYGEQQSDISFSRVPNGTGPFGFRTPTFNANNDDGTTSLNEIDFASTALSVHPNPATDYLEIVLKEEVNQIMLVKVFDIYGRQVLQSTTNTNNIILDTQALIEGLYFVVINDQLGQKVLIAK